MVSVKGWESNSKEEMQHDSNVKVCTEAKMQKTVHVHVEAVYCHQGAVWKTRWSKYWGSEVMIMQIRSLLWIKTEFWNSASVALCASHELCCGSLFCYSQLFSTSRTCTASLHSMFCWCFSQHYASLSLQPPCRWNSHNPLLHSTTSKQGDTSTGPLFRFFSLQV